MRHTFEEDDRSNNSDSETNSSVASSVKKYVEDKANDSDSRFHQKVGHFATQIRCVTSQGTNRKTYRNGRTGCSQNTIQIDVSKPHTFWLMMSSLDEGLEDGDDMVKAFDKQTQTTAHHHSSTEINPSVYGTIEKLHPPSLPLGFFLTVFRSSIKPL